MDLLKRTREPGRCYGHGCLAQGIEGQREHKGSAAHRPFEVPCIILVPPPASGSRTNAPGVAWLCGEPERIPPFVLRIDPERLDQPW
jgi:hypothetical protein